MQEDKELDYVELKRLLNEFMDGMSQAFGGAWQLAHAYSDPRWLTVRDAIGSCKDACVSLMLKWVGRAAAKGKLYV